VVAFVGLVCASCQLRKVSVVYFGIPVLGANPTFPPAQTWTGFLFNPDCSLNEREAGYPRSRRDANGAGECFGRCANRGKRSVPRSGSHDASAPIQKIATRAHSTINLSNRADSTAKAADRSDNHGPVDSKPAGRLQVRVMTGRTYCVTTPSAVCRARVRARGLWLVACEPRDTKSAEPRP
jgi:hypothetical protein